MLLVPLARPGRIFGAMGAGLSVMPRPVPFIVQRQERLPFRPAEDPPLPVAHKEREKQHGKRHAEKSCEQQNFHRGNAD